MNVEDLNKLLSHQYMAGEIQKVQNMIRRNMSIPSLRENAIERLWMQVGKRNETKTLTSIDHRAEANFIENLTWHFGEENIYVVGEESLYEGLNLSDRTQICVLVDMIDGTDLLERKMSNWCSAVIVFNPQERKILGAYVALADEGMLYFAREDQSKAYRVKLARASKDEPEELGELIKKDAMLQDASMCIYGQKSGSMLRLLSLHENERFTSRLRELGVMESEYRTKGFAQDVKFRFYNLAGNPMMARLTEGHFDVVADPVGQQPHDMAAGAFIADRAGATLVTETGEPLKMEVIADALSRPADSAVKYILASNEALAKEMAELLRGAG